MNYLKNLSLGQRVVLAFLGSFAFVQLAPAADLTPILAQASGSGNLANLRKAIAFGMGVLILVAGTFLMGGAVIEGIKECGDGRWGQGMPKIGLGLAVVIVALIGPSAVLSLFGLGNAGVGVSDVQSALNNL